MTSFFLLFFFQKKLKRNFFKTEVINYDRRISNLDRILEPPSSSSSYSSFHHHFDYLTNCKTIDRFAQLTLAYELFIVVIILHDYLRRVVQVYHSCRLFVYVCIFICLRVKLILSCIFLLFFLILLYPFLYNQFCFIT